MHLIIVFILHPFCNTNISQYLKDHFCYCHLGISYITIGVQNNSSHIVLCLKSIHLDALLVPVPIDKPASKNFQNTLSQLNFQSEELEILRSGNKETLALGLCNNPPQQNRAVFLYLFKLVWWYFNLIKRFWNATFEYSSCFDC